MLRNILENEGVFCQIFNETGAQVYNFYTQSNGGIILKVHEKDLEKAQSILESNIRNDLLTETLWNSDENISDIHHRPKIRLFIGLFLLLAVLIAIVWYFGKG